MGRGGFNWTVLIIVDYSMNNFILLILVLLLTHHTYQYNFKEVTEEDVLAGTCSSLSVPKARY